MMRTHFAGDRSGGMLPTKVDTIARKCITTGSHSPRCWTGPCAQTSILTPRSLRTCVLRQSMIVLLANGLVGACCSVGSLFRNGSLKIQGWVCSRSPCTTSARTLAHLMCAALQPSGKANGNGLGWGVMQHASHNGKCTKRECCHKCTSSLHCARPCMPSPTPI